MEGMYQSTNYAKKKCIYSKVICLLIERNFHTPNMTNLAITQFTIFMTLINKFNLGIQLNYRNGQNSNLSFTIIQLLPSLKVNIIIVHPRGVVIRIRIRKLYFDSAHNKTVQHKLYRAFYRIYINNKTTQVTCKVTN